MSNDPENELVTLQHMMKEAEEKAIHHESEAKRWIAIARKLSDVVSIMAGKRPQLEKQRVPGLRLRRGTWLQRMKEIMSDGVPRDRRIIVHEIAAKYNTSRGQAEAAVQNCVRRGYLLLTDDGKFIPDPLHKEMPQLLDDAKNKLSREQIEEQLRSVMEDGVGMPRMNLRYALYAAFPDSSSQSTAQLLNAAIGYGILRKEGKSYFIQTQISHNNDEQGANQEPSI